jgi:hypothetical protein
MYVGHNSERKWHALSSLFGKSMVVQEHEKLRRLRLGQANKFKVENLDKMEERNRRVRRGNRSIEKSIYEVINLVSLWIKLSESKIHLDKETGFFKLGPDTSEKMDRETAAAILHTPKKSLNDYLLHLRYGRHYGFDFKRNQFCRMGALRKFVALKKEERALIEGCLRICYIKSDEFEEGFDFLGLLD